LPLILLALCVKHRHSIIYTLKESFKRDKKRFLLHTGAIILLIGLIILGNFTFASYPTWPSGEYKDVLASGEISRFEPASNTTTFVFVEDDNIYEGDIEIGFEFEDVYLDALNLAVGESIFIYADAYGTLHIERGSILILHQTSGTEVNK
jgi:hypothetical protein